MHASTCECLLRKHAHAPLAEKKERKRRRRRKRYAARIRLCSPPMLCTHLLAIRLCLAAHAVYASALNSPLLAVEACAAKARLPPFSSSCPSFSSSSPFVFLLLLSLCSAICLHTGPYSKTWTGTNRPYRSYGPVFKTLVSTTLAWLGRPNFCQHHSGVWLVQLQ